MLTKLDFCDKMLEICEDAKTYGLTEEHKDRETCDAIMSFFKRMKEFYKHRTDAEGFLVY